MLGSNSRPNVSEGYEVPLNYRGDRPIVYICVCMYVCMYVFIKLHITTQSGPVILVILCHSH